MFGCHLTIGRTHTLSAVRFASFPCARPVLQHAAPQSADLYERHGTHTLSCTNQSHIHAMVFACFLLSFAISESLARTPHCKFCTTRNAILAKDHTARSLNLNLTYIFHFFAFSPFFAFFTFSRHFTFSPCRLLSLSRLSSSLSLALSLCSLSLLSLSLSADRCRLHDLPVRHAERAGFRQPARGLCGRRLLSAAARRGFLAGNENEFHIGF